MNKLDIYRSMGSVVKQLNLGDIITYNENTKKYGLYFTASEAEELIEARERSISHSGRVELGIDVVRKIIAAFCSSPYIILDNYAETIGELIDIYYIMKNETEDCLGDDELIELMLEYYNGSCQGSLDLLRNRELTLYAGNFRRMLQESEYSRQRSKYDQNKQY